MDIYEFALTRERDSEVFYRDVAADCKSPGLQGILLRLADAEVRHQQIIEAMKAKTSAKITADPFLRDVKGLFAAVRDLNVPLTVEAPQVALYRRAQGFEKESWEMYAKAAEQAETKVAKSVLHRLAAQERVHFQVLATLVELVSRPLQGQWLENAEWYHLDQY